MQEIIRYTSYVLHSLQEACDVFQRTVVIIKNSFRSLWVLSVLYEYFLFFMGTSCSLWILLVFMSTSCSLWILPVFFMSISCSLWVHPVFYEYFLFFMSTSCFYEYFLFCMNTYCSLWVLSVFLILPVFYEYLLFLWILPVFYEYFLFFMSTSCLANLFYYFNRTIIEYNYCSNNPTIILRKNWWFFFSHIYDYSFHKLVIIFLVNLQ